MAMSNLRTFFCVTLRWRWRHVVSSISVVVILLPILCYILRFAGNGLSADTEKWAQFGDYIGGTYSVILSILVIYIARNLTRKDENSNRRRNAVDEIYQQIIKIELCVNLIQKANAANRLLKLSHIHQLHISEELCRDVENLANYYIGVSNGTVTENIGYEVSMKEKLKEEYDGN